MKKFLLVSLFFVSSLFADQVIYISYDKVPTRVIQGELSSFTLKSLSTVKEYSQIDYHLSNYSGIKLLERNTTSQKIGKYTYENFPFLVTDRYPKLPDITASLKGSQEYDSITIRGSKLTAIRLNPRKDFSHILANSLHLVDYKTTAYDNKSNILVFSLRAEHSYLQAITFKNAIKQGIESINDSVEDAKVTYYVVISKKIENFSFSYFNLLQNKFNSLEIPIIVDDDSVVTQSDLKPKDQSHEMLKVEIAAAFAFLAFLFILWRKKYIYLVFILLPLGYIAFMMLPAKEVCIKQGSQLHLLPVDNGTIFETTTSQYTLTKEGMAKGYTKVKLKNDKIGWVRNEDVCSY